MYNFIKRADNTPNRWLFTEKFYANGSEWSVCQYYGDESTTEEEVKKAYEEWLNKDFIKIKQDKIKSLTSK